MNLTFVNAPLLHRMAITAEENHLTGDRELPVTRLWISPAPTNLSADATLFAVGLLLAPYTGRYLSLSGVEPSIPAFEAFEGCFPDLRLASSVDLSRTQSEPRSLTVTLQHPGSDGGERDQASFLVRHNDNWIMERANTASDLVIDSNFSTLTRTPEWHRRLAAVLLLSGDWRPETIEMSLHDPDFKSAWTEATESVGNFSRSLFGALREIGIKLVAI